jgi:hypothetical protein
MPGNMDGGRELFEAPAHIQCAVSESRNEKNLIRDRGIFGVSERTTRRDLAQKAAAATLRRCRQNARVDARRAKHCAQQADESMAVGRVIEFAAFDYR